MIFRKNYEIRYPFSIFLIYDKGGGPWVPAAHPYHKIYGVTPQGRSVFHKNRPPAKLTGSSNYLAGSIVISLKNLGAYFTYTTILHFITLLIFIMIFNILEVLFTFESSGLYFYRNTRPLSIERETPERYRVFMQVMPCQGR